jgi:hypothetical protein
MDRERFILFGRKALRAIKRPWFVLEIKIKFGVRDVPELPPE